MRLGDHTEPTIKLPSRAQATAMATYMCQIWSGASLALETLPHALEQRLVLVLPMLSGRWRG